MPKILICASTLSHIENFHQPYLAFFKMQGFEVHIAVPEHDSFDKADMIHEIPMTKSFISIRNLAAIVRIRDIVKSGRFDLIITHTTLAAFIVRLGVWFSGRRKAKLINTVHGYFFWDTCGFLNKCIYSLPERLLRSVTDCVITMNNEDYHAARKLVKKDGLVVKVPGMGVDATRFSPATEEEKLLARRILTISPNAFVLVYAAEFSKRKNHIELIRALFEIKKSIPNVLLLLCGNGMLQSFIEAEVDRLGLRDNVKFLGWCSHMEQIYKACDLSISTSKSEGLPFNIIEAQLSALPVIASQIRGHTDLIEDEISGWLYPIGNPTALADVVINVFQSSDQGKRQGAAAEKSAMQYTLDVAYMMNTEAYLRVLDNEMGSLS